MSRTPDVFFGAGYAAPGSTNPHWIKQNEFYHCRADGGDGFGYIGRDKAIEKDALGYAGERPGSTGLWGPDGFYTKEDIKEMREKLRGSDCPVWHGVVSFSAEFGEKYAWDTKQAQKLIKDVMPRFLKAQGLSIDNVTWTAAYHVNTDNNHVHLLWFENEPLKGTAKNPRYSKGRVPP